MPFLVEEAMGHIVATLVAIETLDFWDNGSGSKRMSAWVIEPNAKLIMTWILMRSKKLKVYLLSREMLFLEINVCLSDYNNSKSKEWKFQQFYSYKEWIPNLHSKEKGGKSSFPLWTSTSQCQLRNRRRFHVEGWYGHVVVTNAHMSQQHYFPIIIIKDVQAFCHPLPGNPWQRSNRFLKVI
jgi:hypothetical protein